MTSSAAHVHHALHAIAGSNGSRGHAVLAGAGFGDDPRLAHALGQQGLADAVVDLVRAGMVEVFALQVDLRTAEQVGPALGMVDRRRPADKVLQFVLVLRAEGRIGLGGGIGRLQFVERAEQGFGNEDTAVGAEMALGIRKSVRRSGHGNLSANSGRMNERTPARIRDDSPDGAANKSG